jgi:hypothetical protein
MDRVVTWLASISEEPGSNLDQHMIYRRMIFVVILITTRHIPARYLKIGHDLLLPHIAPRLV